MVRITPGDVLWMVVCLLLLALPASYEPHHFAKALFVGALAQSAACVLLLLAALKRWKGARMAVFSVLFALFTLETFVYVVFDSRFNPAVLTLVLQTSGQEIAEFSSVYLLSWRSVCVLGACVLTYYLLYKLISRPWRREWKLGWAWLGAACLAVVTGLFFSQLPLPFPTGRNTLAELSESVGFIRSNHQDLERMEMLLDSIRIDGSPRPEEAPVIVLVIGESYNKHHSSVYGYRLKTSPEMEKERKKGRLTVYDRAVTPTNGTAFAMRYLFTLQSCDDADNTRSRCILMPAVFRKAGYRVAYFDNQYTRASGGELDYSCVFFLNPQKTNRACFDFRNEETLPYDNDFVNRYAKNMLTACKSLNIIHLMGQHFDAAKRYPAGEAHFGERDIERSDLSRQERRQVAEYDNATRYNDKVMGNILRRFDKACETGVVVVFLSDHGEQIYDGTSHSFGRSFGSYHDAETLRNVYEVPFMIWCDETFERLYPAKYEAIRQAAERQLCIDDVPYLLFDLAGISFNYGQPWRSVTHKDYRRHATVFN